MEIIVLNPAIPICVTKEDMGAQFNTIYIMGFPFSIVSSIEVHLAHNSCILCDLH